jgi:hypothetical protein
VNPAGVVDRFGSGPAVRDGKDPDGPVLPAKPSVLRAATTQTA